MKSRSVPLLQAYDNTQWIFCRVDSCLDMILVPRLTTDEALANEEQPPYFKDELFAIVDVEMS
jgi:hypothetical protein